MATALIFKKKCLIFPDFYPTSTGSFIYAFKNYIRVPFFFIYLPSTQWRRWVRPLRGGRGWTHAGWVKYTPPLHEGKVWKRFVSSLFLSLSPLSYPPPPFTQICHHSFRAKCPSLCVYATATAPPVEGDIEVYTSTCLRSYCLAMSVTTPTLRVKESGEHLTYPRQLNLSCFILKGKA